MVKVVGVGAVVVIDPDLSAERLRHVRAIRRRRLGEGGIRPDLFVDLVLVQGVVLAVPIDIEDLDFFDVQENRQLILEHETNHCFYCRRKLNERNYVIEHVQSRPAGNNSYRNVVAACRECNNRKNDSSVEDWLRTLYREGFLGPAEFEERLSHLQRLREGLLKPNIPV